MQPENQPGNPAQPAPQAPQPMPQPAYQAAPQQSFSVREQIQPSSQQPPVPQSSVAQPPQYQPPAPPPVAPVQPQPESQLSVAPQAPQQPLQSAQPLPVAPEALGSVAVADQIEGGYGYDPGEEEEYEDEGEEIDLSQPVTWQAKEFIHQEKGATWFIAFAATIAVFMAVAILLMRSWSFAVLLVVIAIVIVILSKRPPRVMEYALSEEGLHIDNTVHKYEDFKSFGVIHDTNEFSVMLIPRRRFMPGITVYFPEEAGEDIVDVLGSRLPMRDLHLDVVDKIVRKLRL